jgi:hypothetical protein
MKIMFQGLNRVSKVVNNLDDYLLAYQTKWSIQNFQISCTPVELHALLSKVRTILYIRNLNCTARHYLML